MEVLATSLSGVPLLKVIGDVDDSTSPVLDESVQKALGPDGTRLFLDLADCPYIDSGGLSVLLATLRHLSGKGWLWGHRSRAECAAAVRDCGIDSRS